MAEPVKMDEEFDVGGVRLPRPFRLLRLGHFGVNATDPEAARDFYCRILGFRVSDPIDFGRRLPEGEPGKHGPGVGYFTRHGGDHHSLVLFPRRVMSQVNPHYRKYPELTVNQMTWQVSSLREVVDGFEWFKRRGNPVLRQGRDLPGSNWHFYPPDPDGHINELYYGIEQIGWDGYSKPHALHRQRYDKPPGLPHRSEHAEIVEALKEGLDVRTGWRAEEAEESFDVGGIHMARPFKITRIGPIRLFVRDLDVALRFYRDELGFTLTEETAYRGHRCLFLRVNTEHHSLALYPRALRAELDLSESTSLMSFGLQLANYRQLHDAIALPAARWRARALPATRAFARNRLLGVRHRSRRPRAPAVLLHGADPAGRKAAPGAPAAEGRPSQLAAERAGGGDALNGEIYLGPWSWDLFFIAFRDSAPRRPFSTSPFPRR
jgi:catechol 2,3-dioxygenase-like lactoylglutathione lyase family enzyme